MLEQVMRPRVLNRGWPAAERGRWATRLDVLGFPQAVLAS